MSKNQKALLAGYFFDIFGSQLLKTEKIKSVVYLMEAKRYFKAN